MKVSKNSWHYKLATSCNTVVAYRLTCEYPVSLCQYFWSVVGGTCLWTVMGLIGLLCAWGLLTPFATFFVAITGDDYGIGFLKMSAEVGSIILPILWMVIPMMVGCGMWREGDIELCPKWMKINIRPRVKKDKQPSLIVEWVKAKKAKVCPLVEVSDE